MEAFLNRIAEDVSPEDIDSLDDTIEIEDF